MKVALYEPKIPQNTGAITRTCAATRTPLLLIGEMGFELSEKRVRRAGLDYWPYVEWYHYQSWEEYDQKHPNQPLWILSTKGSLPYFEAPFSATDTLLFGNEISGLPPWFFEKFGDRVLTIPMLEPGVRSLNLSNAVSIVLYEALRKTGLLSTK